MFQTLNSSISLHTCILQQSLLQISFVPDKLEHLSTPAARDIVQRSAHILIQSALQEQHRQQSTSAPLSIGPSSAVLHDLDQVRIALPNQCEPLPFNCYSSRILLAVCCRLPPASIPGPNSLILPSYFLTDRFTIRPVHSSRRRFERAFHTSGRRA